MWLAALVARLTRSGMFDVLSQDYIRTARAKGLAECAVTARHAVRNTLVPIVTVVGLQAARLLGGAVMTETVFAWPGVGTLVLESIMKRDYPVVLAALILVATAFVLINLLVDVLYCYLDPRVTDGGAAGLVTLALAAAAPEPTGPRPSPIRCADWRAFGRRRLLGAALLMLVVGGRAAAPLVAPYGLNEMS